MKVVNQQGFSRPARTPKFQMSLRDAWQRTLIYFGLAEERDEFYDEEEYETTDTNELEGQYLDRPNVRRLAGRRRRDEIDEIFADEPSEERTGILKSVKGGRNGQKNGDVRVHLVLPKSFNDAQQIADKFKDSIPVILNLQSVDPELSKRLIDFVSGLTYALEGGMQRIADKIFLLTPQNVKVSAEEQARLIEQGFFNQS